MPKPLNDQSQEYWEKILSDSGLSMNRGHPSQIWIDRGTLTERREDKLSYVGTSNDLVNVESEQYSKKTGKKRKS